jgi:hypothetical protein
VGLPFVFFLVFTHSFVHCGACLFIIMHCGAALWCLFIYHALWCCTVVLVYRHALWCLLNRYALWCLLIYPALWCSMHCGAALLCCTMMFIFADNLVIKIYCIGVSVVVYQLLYHLKVKYIVINLLIL